MSVFRASTAAALVALVAAPALAAEVPSDPVERCRGLLAAAPAGSPLRDTDTEIGSVEALGDEGCKFTDLKLSRFDEPVTVSVEEVTITKLDFAAAYEGKPSNAMVAQAKGISVDSPEAAAVLGSDAKSFDLAIDYAFDPATRQFTLNEFTLRGDSLGELALTGVLDGVSPDSATEALRHGTASLRSIELHFENKGIIDRVLAFATASGEDPEAAIEQGRSQAVLGMAALAAVGVPEAAVKSLMAFAQDFPTPKGPITISAEPAAPVPLAQFATIQPGDAKSMDLVQSLNVTVSY